MCFLLRVIGPGIPHTAHVEEKLRHFAPESIAACNKAIPQLRSSRGGLVACRRIRPHRRACRKCLRRPPVKRTYLAISIGEIPFQYRHNAHKFPEFRRKLVVDNRLIFAISQWQGRGKFVVCTTSNYQTPHGPSSPNEGDLFPKLAVTKTSQKLGEILARQLELPNLLGISA